MATAYFKNFPTISYGNAFVTNIIARAKIDSEVRNKTSVFFPYTVREGERPDTIAQNYYEDPNFAWLIYYANEIIDPYFQWPLSQNEISEYIKTKYQSVAQAQERILFFRNNWESDESMISPGAYDSLPAALKKYWAPVFDFKNKIVSYERAKHDTVIETNKTVEINHDGAVPFAVDQIVKQGTAASGIVVSASDGVVIVDKIQGEFTTGSITNFANTSTATVTSVTTLKQSLSDIESVYFSPVSAFDYEEELNEQRKEIYILDRAYLNQIEIEMKNLLT